MMKINLHDKVGVRLTEIGKELLKARGFTSFKVDDEGFYWGFSLVEVLTMLGSPFSTNASFGSASFDDVIKIDGPRVAVEAPIDKILKVGSWIKFWKYERGIVLDEVCSIERCGGNHTHVCRTVHGETVALSRVIEAR